MALPLATITGKVYTPDGVVATAGSILCLLSTAGSVNDAGSGVTERVAGVADFAIQSSGDVEAGMSLVPNGLITPTGTYYRVRFSVTAPTVASWEEAWSIAASGGIEIGDITRLYTPPGLVLPATYRDPAYYRAPNNARITGRAYFASDLTNAVTTTALISGANLRAFPFIVPRSGVIDRLFWQVTTAGTDFSADGRMSIYSNTSDADPYPLNNLLDGTEFRVDQTGLRTSTVSLNVTAGSLLWFAFNHNDTSGLVQMTAFATGTCYAIFGRADTGANPGTGVSVAQAYTSGAGNPAVFPTTSPTVHISSVPALGVRYASVTA